MLLIALALATGAHWEVLQSVAWTTMLAKNLRRESFQEAVVRTFDGKHPCQMCKAVNAGKNTTKKPEFTNAASRFEFYAAARCTIAHVAEPPVVVPVADESAIYRAVQPPTPPPRAFCG
jgi:hypothetical protein